MFESGENKTVSGTIFVPSSLYQRRQNKPGMDGKVSTPSPASLLEVLLLLLLLFCIVRFFWLFLVFLVGWLLLCCCCCCCCCCFCLFAVVCLFVCLLFWGMGWGCLFCFYSSLEMSEPRWLHPEDVKLEGKRHFSCVHTHRATPNKYHSETRMTASVLNQHPNTSKVKRNAIN